MRNRIHIDSKHSRALDQEIEERLRAFLQEEPDSPETLRRQIDRLREFWKSSHHQSFQRMRVGTRVAIEPP
jgi:hypothetical protein